jgi:hypothetical protein
MAKKEKEAGTKVVTLESVDAGLGEMLSEGLITDQTLDLIEKGFIKAELDVVGVESDKFLGDYVRLSLGDNAKTEKQVIAALLAISGGNLRAPMKEDDPKVADTRKPSLEKFTLYGADLAARGRTSQRVRSAAEGPEKAIEKMADQIQKAKPGKFTREQAIAKATRMLAEDDDE